jgi:hypothetical protein
MPGGRHSLMSVGVIAILVGLIWIGQGTGYFPYPRSSFMVNDVGLLRRSAGYRRIGSGCRFKKN